MGRVRLYIEHKHSPVRFFPPNIMEDGFELRLSDFGVEDLEFNVEDFYLGLECEDMDADEVAYANACLARHFGGSWELAKFVEEE